MTSAEALALVNAREFVYVSVSYRRRVEVDEQHPHGITFENHEFVFVGSGLGNAAGGIAKAYARMMWGGDIERFTLYPRNYIREARALVASGDFIHRGIDITATEGSNS